MSLKKFRVVVEVRGGSVVGVYGGDFIEVVLVDWDDIGESRGADGQATMGAVIWHPEPEPQMQKVTEELVERARREPDDAEDGSCPGLCGRAASDCARYDDEAAAHEITAKAAEK